MLRRALGVMAAGLVLAGPMAAQEAVPTVAVIDFHAFSIMPGENPGEIGRGLAAMITTELATRPTVRVVDRQRVEDLIRTRQLGLSGRIDDEQAVQMARLLGAQYVVVGNVALEPRQARIDLRMLDVATGAIERAERLRGSRDELLDLVEQVAEAFTKDLRLPAVTAPAELAIPAPAALAYSRGLDYERRGERARAAEMYRLSREVVKG